MRLLMSLMCYDHLSSLLHRILRSLFFVLEAFGKLRNANFSIAMSVCLSVCREQLGSLWRDFYEIRYSNIFRKSVEKV